MSKSASGFGAAKGGGESEHAEREKNGGKEEQDGDGMREFADSDGAEKCGAHCVERVGDGIETSEKLEPIGKNRNWE